MSAVAWKSLLYGVGEDRSADLAKYAVAERCFARCGLTCPSSRRRDFAQTG